MLCMENPLKLRRPNMLKELITKTRSFRRFKQEPAPT